METVDARERTCVGGVVGGRWARARKRDARRVEARGESDLNSPRSGGLNPRVRTVAFAWECALDEGMGR